MRRIRKVGNKLPRTGLHRLGGSACDNIPSKLGYELETSVRTSEEVVQEQVEAYNAHDMAAFLASYCEAVEVLRFPENTLLIRGQEALRAAYTSRFAPGSKIHAKIIDRIVEGPLVIDKEVIAGLIPDRHLEATAIYEVRDGLIARVWFARSWSPEDEELAARGPETTQSS